MNRRDILKGTGALAFAAVAKSALAEEHEHHHHATGAYSKVISTASTCVEKGQLCVAHCLTLLGEGDKDMAECAKSVHQMLAVCSTLQQLASQNSSHTAEIAALAAKTCKECEEACKKHADKHAECKDCMEACADCRKECEALSG